MTKGGENMMAIISICSGFGAVLGTLISVAQINKRVKEHKRLIGFKEEA